MKWTPLSAMLSSTREVPGSTMGSPLASASDAAGHTICVSSMAVGTVIAVPHRHDASSGSCRKAVKPAPKSVTDVPPALTPPVGCRPVAHRTSLRTAQWEVVSGCRTRVKTLGCG